MSWGFFKMHFTVTWHKVSNDQTMAASYWHIK